MTVQDEERIATRYKKMLDEHTNLDDIEKWLAALEDDPDADALRSCYCDEIIYVYCAGYAKYPDKENSDMMKLRQRVISNIDKLPAKENEYTYLRAVSCFFKGDYKGCIKLVRKHLDAVRGQFAEKPMNEEVWADAFLDTFKDAYPGFWIEMAKSLNVFPCDRGVVELCYLVDDYYKCKSDEEAVDVLLPFAGSHPELSLPKELLGFTYVRLKMWNNAISCFDQVEKYHVLFYDWDIAFQMAWCYGKLKDYKAEEVYYRKCLDGFPDYKNAENNLGYCLYKQKRYAEAIEVFLRCLDEKRDLPTSASDYVRVLLACGQYRTALEFIESKKYKVDSDLVKRAKRHKPENITLKSISTEVVSEENVADAEKAPPDFGINRQQFSSEKTLEDELVARIESGQEIFGLQLKIYKRKGDFYGRQYPIASGKWRLDLLCEDRMGDLYVIELKRDSGYDDPYEQIKNYVKWLRANRCPNGKDVFGIICLNSPTQSLIAKVRKDDRIRLFEYQISYREIN